VIRKFHPRDLAGILKIENASFGVDAWPAELFREYARACPRLFLVAELNGTIAGYIIACLEKERAEIASIAVLPRYRGRRIASQLLTRTLRTLEGLGASTVSLMVRRDNLSAIELYRKFGFIRTATVHGYYEDGAVAWRMKRTGMV
jgi:[ribosomal protein S18]-alanine N-acetyltransferase